MRKETELEEEMVICGKYGEILCPTCLTLDLEEKIEKLKK